MLSTCTLIRSGYSHIAFFRLIQGSDADTNKKAMIEIHKEAIITVEHVHDELDITVKDDKEANQIVEVV